MRQPFCEVAYKQCPACLESECDCNCRGCWDYRHELDSEPRFRRRKPYTLEMHLRNMQEHYRSTAQTGQTDTA